MIRNGLRDRDPGTIYVLQIGEFTKVGFTSKLEGLTLYEAMKTIASAKRQNSESH